MRGEKRAPIEMDNRRKRISFGVFIQKNLYKNLTACKPVNVFRYEVVFHEYNLQVAVCSVNINSKEDQSVINLIVIAGFLLARSLYHR